VAGAGLQLLFLKFGRDDERQSDDLALRYMSRTGYDLRESPDVYEMLRTVSAFSGGGGGVPEWLSTHPDPENRRERIQAQVDTIAPSPAWRVGREEYLSYIDGMTYGDNPREGFFREQAFHHPDLRFRLEFPRGWRTANSKQAVAGMSPEEDAIVQLTLGEGDSPVAATRAFVSQQGVSGGAVQSGDINGHPAASASFAATTEQGTLRGIVAFVSYGGLLYRLMGFTPEARWSAYRGVFQGFIGSFDELTDPAALSVQPLRLEIVQLERAMTLEEFARRYPSQVGTVELALLNQVEVGQRIPAGTRVKRVVGGPLP
jgi:predicted Zn-dependent protease